MRNSRIPLIANQLREAGFDVFDDWYSPGKNADDEWQAYEQIRGRTYQQALEGAHAKDVFEFDKTHLDKASACVLALPAGKSAHIELGYMIGKGKAGYILLPGEPERYDIMYKFATGVATSLEELLPMLRTTGELVGKAEIIKRWKPDMRFYNDRYTD